MDKYELLNAVEEAQEKLFEAIELLEAYVNETDDQNTKAYIVDHLKIMASNGHGFMSSDLNLDDVKTRIMEDDKS